MVLSLKRWKSRSSPGIVAGGYEQRGQEPIHIHPNRPTRSGRQQHPGHRCHTSTRPNPSVAGWSSPVARQAHNLKVTGSNPVPATDHHETPPVKRWGFVRLGRTSRRSTRITTARDPLTLLANSTTPSFGYLQVSPKIRCSNPAG